MGSFDICFIPRDIVKNCFVHLFAFSLSYLFIKMISVFLSPVQKLTEYNCFLLIFTTLYVIYIYFSDSFEHQRTCPKGETLISAHTKFEIDITMLFVTKQLVQFCSYPDNILHFLAERLCPSTPGSLRYSSNLRILSMIIKRN